MQRHAEPQGWQEMEGKPAGDGAAEKWSEPDRKHSLDLAAEPEGFAAGPGTGRPTTVSPSQTYSNLMYMKRSQNQESRSMISMLGKANPNQEAKFTMSLLSGNNLMGDTPVHPHLYQMLGCGEWVGWTLWAEAELQLGPES